MSNTMLYNDIHTDITDKLSNFIGESKIPNFISSTDLVVVGKEQ